MVKYWKYLSIYCEYSEILYYLYCIDVICTIEQSFLLWVNLIYGPQTFVLCIFILKCLIYLLGFFTFIINWCNNKLMLSHRLLLLWHFLTVHLILLIVVCISWFVCCLFLLIVLVFQITLESVVKQQTYLSFSSQILSMAGNDTSFMAHPVSKASSSLS